MILNPWEVQIHVYCNGAFQAQSRRQLQFWSNSYTIQTFDMYIVTKRIHQTFIILVKICWNVVYFYSSGKRGC